MTNVATRAAERTRDWFVKRCAISISDREATQLATIIREECPTEALRAENEKLGKALQGIGEENARLREAGAKVCEGFDDGLFIRSTKGDGDSGWVIKLLPYLRALAVLAEKED